MLFVNDPKIEDVPAVGSGVVLVSERTRAGEAVRWSPSGDAQALAVFLGPNFKSFEGTVFCVSAQNVMTPVSWLGEDVVVVKPPAGEIFVVWPGSFTQEFAKVVVPAPADAEPVVDEVPAEPEEDLEALTIPQLQDLLRGKDLPVSGSKAELVERLRDA